MQRCHDEQCYLAHGVMDEQECEERLVFKSRSYMDKDEYKLYCPHCGEYTIDALASVRCENCEVRLEYGYMTKVNDYEYYCDKCKEEK